MLGHAAAALAWLGRQGTRAVALSLVLGIALPPLGALLRPFFAETVVLLLCLAFLRIDPPLLRKQFTRPRLLILGATWSMLAMPFLLGLGLLALDLRDWAPALFFALMLHAVAPPIFSSPALAALMGLDAAISLAFLIACTAATPWTAPALAAAFVGQAITISPVALGLRLALILAGSACAAAVIRTIAGKDWVERQAERIDGLSVIALFVFAAALMSNVLENLFANPLLMLSLVALSSIVSLIIGGLTALVFLPAGKMRALTLAHAASSRNMGLMLAAAAGAAPDLVWLYVALAQIPIYLLPILLKPLARRFTPRQNAA
jgi:BASS family bile acid:Na+ symporter